MKRFLAFGHATFYPGGGAKDLVGEFDHYKDAEKAAKCYENWHVVDTHAGVVMYRDYDNSLATAFLKDFAHGGNTQIGST